MDRHKIVAGAAGMAVGCGTVWATYFGEENWSGGGQHACLTSNSGTKETAARLASGLPGPVLADLITAKKDAPLARIMPKFDIVLSPANSSGGAPVIGGIAGVGGAAGIKRKKGGRKAGGNSFLDGAEEVDSWDTELPALMTMAEMQKHVEAASRVAVSPCFSEEACSVLHAYYLVIRQAKVDQDVGDVSLLTLESLIRVAISCAKLCMRQSVVKNPDVLVAILLSEHTFMAKDASAQLSRAVEGGVNFFDTAEMYPVPQRAETQVKGEGGVNFFDTAEMYPVPQRAETQGSLRDLSGSGPIGSNDVDKRGPFCPGPRKVRYIGLSNETAWGLGKFLEAASQPATPSSSSPLCPRPIALQNAYSLLCRTFDSTLAESCHHEHIPLLAYSPLAMGLLSGKYHCSPQMLSGKHRSSPSADPATSANADTSADAATSASIDTVLLLAQSLDLHQSSDPTDTNNRIFQDPSWRLVKYRNRYAEAEGRYPISNPRVATAVRAYADVARRFHVSPVQLALAFVLAHPLVGAAVVGASCLQQLEEILSVVGEGEGAGVGGERG
ncbi:unnamed protein product [Closterium sp. NIES-64]|nr:unnamed protein product [Closterium sp. NIES-64]